MVIAARITKWLRAVPRQTPVSCLNASPTQTAAGLQQTDAAFQFDNTWLSGNWGCQFAQVHHAQPQILFTTSATRSLMDTTPHCGRDEVCRTAAGTRTAAYAVLRGTQCDRVLAMDIAKWPGRLKCASKGASELLTNPDTETTLRCDQPHRLRIFKTEERKIIK